MDSNPIVQGNGAISATDGVGEAIIIILATEFTPSPGATATASPVSAPVKLLLKFALTQSA